MTLPLHQIPNIITVVRILLVVPVAYYLYQSHYKTALWLFFIAGVSDGIDGFLARRFRWKTRFGAIADPLADKLLMVVTYLMLTLVDHLPQWLFLLIVGRDLILVGGGVLYHYRFGAYEVQPSWLGKLCTFSQITYMLVVMFSLAGLPMPTWAVEQGLWLVALITAVSGIHYIVLWWRKAWAQLQH